jgi:hypothetical protein
MPACAVSEQNDNPLVVRIYSCGKLGQSKFHEADIHRGQQNPEAVSGGRMDKSIDVQPLVPTMLTRNGTYPLG